MLKTNVNSLVEMKLKGEIIHPELWVEGGYTTTWDGRPKLTVGIGGIVHNVRVGDPVFGWYADHLNAGAVVSDQNPEKQSAINIYSCIGNKVKVLTGEAKGAIGVVVGKTYFSAGWSYRIIVDFPPLELEKLAIGDKVEIKAWGTGLLLEDFKEIKILSLSPELFNSIGLYERDQKIVVPVVKTLPGYMMGVGVGRGISEAGAWDIQSCSSKLNQMHKLESLRFGDLVAITDVTSNWGNGVNEGGIVVGIISHGASEIGGHGPGITIIFSSNKDWIEPIIEKNANIAYYLGLRNSMVW